ncbi:alginate lyase family protein [Paenibacillus silviterrae]|uniref:alginate lyase family protein n=1 Tax=Paenibacillus silviterrae TaxID=3242194 RepID=UPI002543BFAF|nr:alginate lyase family protein [Paenibacillus chinjuensis]
MNRIIQDKNPYRERLIALDRSWIISKANEALQTEIQHITDVRADRSEGGAHDYYSNGDYWWPNPDTQDGLPYVKRDGESNPNNFDAHRLILREMRTHVAHLAAGYMVTGNEKYAGRAVQWLKEFFLDEATRMNPHLLYAQAIPGICSGRGIGIIDTLHLIDIPFAVDALQGSDALASELTSGLKQWFADYLRWMCTHPHGVEEMKAANNHSVCWFVQSSVFSRFTGHEEMLEFCRKKYKEVLLPSQMDGNGSFPRELARTKPYGYSIFVLDNMATLCHVLTTAADNLWTFQLPDGRGIRKGFEFLFPYMAVKESWPYPADIEHDEGWPARISGLLFAWAGLGKPEYMDLFEALERDPKDGEVRRNIAIRQPLLWL